MSERPERHFGRIAYFQNGRDSARRMCRGVYDGRRTKTLRRALPDRILIYMLCAVLRLKRDTAKKNKRQAHFAAGGRRGIYRAQRGKIERQRGEKKASFLFPSLALGAAFGCAPRRPLAIWRFVFCFSSPQPAYAAIMTYISFYKLYFLKPPDIKRHGALNVRGTLKQKAQDGYVRAF